jgi:hypothetical protein
MVFARVSVGLIRTSSNFVIRTWECVAHPDCLGYISISGQEIVARIT